MADDKKKTKKRSRSTPKNSGVDRSKDLAKIKGTQKLLMVLLTVSIILTAANFTYLLLASSDGDDIDEGGWAVIDAGDGILLSITSSGETSVDYKVEVELENTGDETTWVSVSGEIRISAMESANGEEVTSVLDFRSIKLSPDGYKELDLGTFTAFKDWHYVISVHVAWDGGSLELTELVIP